MPNRIIRESARSSPTLDQLSDGAERTFWRLTTVADDYGRFDADPRVLLATCYPLRAGSWAPQRLLRHRDELAEATLIQLYEVRGRCYGQFVTWATHQRPRDSKPRFPGPEASAIPALAADCGDSPQLAATGGDLPLARAGMHARPHMRGLREPRAESREPRAEKYCIVPVDTGTPSPPAAPPSEARRLRQAATELLAFLNQRAGRSFRAFLTGGRPSSNLRLIEARLADGASVQECRAVIARKVRTWRGDAKMAPFLRPETLFRASKFESYLGERESVPETSASEDA